MALGVGIPGAIIIPERQDLTLASRSLWRHHRIADIVSIRATWMLVHDHSLS
jgi:hypothetical protein